MTYSVLSIIIYNKTFRKYVLPFENKCLYKAALCYGVYVMSVKEKILNYLSRNSGYNTLTTAQARARFGISNVSARIDELRKEGHSIYTNQKTLSRSEEHTSELQSH